MKLLLLKISASVVLNILLVYQSSAQSNPDYDNYSKKNLANKTVKAVYNWEHKQAKQLLTEYAIDQQNSPVAPFVEAMILYWQHFPFQKKSRPYNLHIQLLKKAVKLAEVRLDRQENDYEASFIKLSARSIIMRHYANFGQTFKAAGEAKKVYGLIIDVMDWKRQYPEFYFITGLYNYYREYYPENHPVYKPFTIFFKSGDKQKGLQQLKYAAENAVFTQPEAMAYLAFIYFRCEADPATALVFYRNLHQLFPGNLYYLKNYIEALLLEKQYDKASKLNDVLKKNNAGAFYTASAATFEGMVDEYYHNDLDNAALHYHKARNLLEQGLDIYSESLKTYTYAGLANYYLKLGDEDAATAYKKLAKEYDEYEYVQ